MTVAFSQHKRVVGLSIWMAVASGSRGPALAQVPSVEPLALVGATVIDGRGGQPLVNAIVVTNGSKILAVGPAGTVPVPPGMRILPARGHFVVPGLWDMHVHTAVGPVSGRRSPDAIEDNAEYFLPLLVAHGIVGVRDMSGQLEVLSRWRKQIASGERLGPRLVITGRKLGGSAVVHGAPWPVRTADDIERSINMLATGGADFVKVENLTPEQWPVVMAAAARAGLPVAGHVEPSVRLAEVARLGLKSAEHLQGILAGCSSEEAGVVGNARRELGLWGRFMIRAGLWKPDERNAQRNRRLLASQDPGRCDVLARSLVQAGTWLTPTLISLAAVHGLAQPRSSELEALFPAGLRRPPRPVTELGRALFAAQLSVVGTLARAGVPLLAGTDCPGTERVPGASLVDELRLLVRAGLTSMQALQAATREPARYLGLADSVGTIAPGMAADLVVVDRDPLVDIGSLDAVSAVVIGGRYLPRTELDRLKSGVRERLRSWAATAERSPSPGPGRGR